VSRPRYERYFYDEGLVGAALFGDFFLLLRKSHSRACFQTHYVALTVFVREKTIRKELLFETQKNTAASAQHYP
jgi:hypothetical protein